MPVIIRGANGSSKPKVPGEILGKDWKTFPAPSKFTYSKIAYGNRTFVAIGSSYFLVGRGNNFEQISPPSSSVTWNAITFGGGKFCVVSNGTSVIFSEDGKTWTSGTLPYSGNWVSVCYIPSISTFYALTEDGRIATKPSYTDSWYLSSTVHSGFNWRKVCYGLNIGVAVAQGDKGAYHNSGALTLVSMPVAGEWRDVCFGMGRFVAVASEVNRGYGTIAYSLDGKTWAFANIPINGYWYRVSYGDGVFIVSSATAILYSLDGIEWFESSAPFSYSWGAMCFGEGKFIALPETSSEVYAYSDETCLRDSIVLTNRPFLGLDGKIHKGLLKIEKAQENFPLSWQNFSSPGGIDYLCFTEEKFVGISYGARDTKVHHSLDGISWEISNALLSTGNHSGLAYGNGVLVTTDVTYRRVEYSLNEGKTWNIVELGSSIYITGEIKFKNGKFFGVGNKGVMYSSDGKTWSSADITGIGYGYMDYGNGVYVLVLQDSAKIYYSYNLTDWAEAEVPEILDSDKRRGNVVFGDGKFVSLPYYSGNSLLYSYDGVHWISATNHYGGFNNLVYGGGKFVAVTKTEYIFSDNGIEWEKATIPGNTNRSCIAYGKGKYLVPSSDGKIYWSTGDLYSIRESDDNAPFG